MKQTDQEKVIETIQAISAVMDNNAFLAAVDRIKGRQSLRLVE
jgi:hypothetical protein